MISSYYQNPSTLAEIQKELYTWSPVGYTVLDNFIDGDFFEKVLKEFENQNNSYLLTDKRENIFMGNKTLLLGTPHFLELYNFFLWNDFEDFLKKIYKEDVKKAKKITPEWVEEHLWVAWQGVAQIYEYGDFMEWHTDLAKDLKRKECLEKWWYAEWDKVEQSEHDEVGAFIYYVYNSDNAWNETSWGVLEIGKFNGHDIVPYNSILPLRNRLVLIKSSHSSYHRVTRIQSKKDYRVSIQDLIIHQHATLWDERL